MYRKVHFRADPVQSRSRLLRNSELDFLQRFENHVCAYLKCREALETSTLDDMCSYCRDIISYIISKFDRHHGYHVEKSGDDDTLTFVEIPRTLTASRHILDLANKRDLRKSRRSSASMRSKDRLHYSNRSEATAGSSPPVTSYRVSARRECGRWSTYYTEVWRAESYEHDFLSRTAVFTSATVRVSTASMFHTGYTTDARGRQDRAR
jgi:hypothetical protein